MNTLYTYWLNDPEWHAQKLCEVFAISVKDADNYFELIHGYNPSKKSNISLTIIDGQ